MNKMLKRSSSGYSLLELIATVTILVALATVMLPYVTVDKNSIYDNTESYNLAGTQRYLEMFNALYSGTAGELGDWKCYPSAFSTGLATNVATAANAGPLSLDNVCLLNNASTGHAMVFTASTANEEGDTTVLSTTNMTTLLADNVPTSLTLGEVISLYKAGIYSFNYGNGTVDSATLNLTALDTTGGLTGATALTSAIVTYRVAPGTALPAITRGSTWDSTGLTIIAGTENVTIKGLPSNSWKANLCTNTTTPATDASIVYLYVSPTMEWDTYYSDPTVSNPAANNITLSYQSEKTPTVQVPVPATSPWMPSTSYRYYIAVMSVDGEPAATISQFTTLAAMKTELESFGAAKIIGILSPADLTSATP